MAYWRMRLRDGKGGQDMWPLCREHEVAAITYNGVSNVDLRPYSGINHPPGWDEIDGGAAKKSLTRFAWEIRGGDTVFVADSKSHGIIAMGHPRVDIGTLAYRFDPGSPIIPDKGDVWRHLIDMDWDDAFVPFRPESIRAPQFTVLDMRQEEIEDFLRQSRRNEHRQSNLPEKEIRTAILLEDEYPRYTSAALRLIQRKHAALSNQFAKWLQDTHQTEVIREKQQIDARFNSGNKTFLVEFKIAYQGNTKRAVREALGQILEYNYYPPRTSHDHWLLVLDCAPYPDDKKFLLQLRKTLRLPLFVGWKLGAIFEFDPSLKL